MRLHTSVSMAALVGVVALGATSAQAAPHRRHAAPKPDPRDARIDALESELGALVQEVRALRAERAAPAPVVAYAPSVGGSGTRVVGNASQGVSGPPSSPDIPRPSPAVASAPAPSGGATILAGKPSITSPDGRFAANLHGVVQFDTAGYFQASARPATVDLRRGAAAADTGHARDLADGPGFRRARVGIDGKAFGDFEYNLLFEFGGSGAEDAAHVQEAWLQYSGFKPFHLKIGAFRPSLGLEDQGSTNGMLFNERPAVIDATASLSGADFREGVQLWATGDRWFASGGVTSRLVGTINSTGSSNAATFDQALGFVGRADFIPFKGDDWLTLVGVHGSYAYKVADIGGPDVAVGTARYPIQFRERPELRVDGTRLVDTGGIDAQHGHTTGFEFAAQKQNLFIQAEYETFGIDRRNSVLSDPDFSGFYVEAAWTLTGERRRFNPNTFAFDAPPVDHPFDLINGTWGAWEVALRYSDLNLNYHKGSAGLAVPTDGVRGGDQQVFNAGLNWYLNPVIRFVLDYQHVDIDRLSPSAVTFATPVGAQIGQKYDTLSLRSQLAF
ncbi:OprO/OprP family phosphate-selective porin [soil metagenome]